MKDLTMTSTPEQQSMNTDDGAGPRGLIVVPCLNEEAHIAAVIDTFAAQARDVGARLVVADGGSSDRTREIVRDRSGGDALLTLIGNEKRLQSAAVNKAVAEFGRKDGYLIRIDAHALYPDDYCRRLVEEAERTGADSVVVAMKTVGRRPFQRATAAAQNSKLGNGGSKHRQTAAACWVDHGHHALMRIGAFTSVGGYDETFSHNEDAELDFRLRQAGYRIWLTDRTMMSYFPRDTVGGLFRQYIAYGRGRARNLLKHRILPKVRQLLPLMIVPVLAGTLLAVFNWMAIVPALLWALICLGYGALVAIQERKAYGALIGVCAMVMHLAWSLGFWTQIFAARRRRGGAA